VLLSGALGLMGWHAFTMQRVATRPTELRFRTELNRADVAELRQLPGIGEKLAARIDEHRQRHGPFRTVEDLRGVLGIGPATLDKLRSFVWVEPRDEEDESSVAVKPTWEPPPRNLPAKPTVQPVGRKSVKAPSRPIDVNRASAGELQQLPGIGPVLSQRIIDARTARPFERAEDLRRVPGIGAKTLERLRPFVAIDAASEAAALAR
jgi:competence protein ComEA